MSDSDCVATIPLEQATASSWDLVVLGAGVAGSTLAIHAAQKGMKVLLVESQTFPREKVCGGCLNQRAQRYLSEMGVDAALWKQGMQSLREIHIRVPNRSSLWKLPELWSVRRSTLDTLLVRKAIQAGVSYLDGTQGTIVASNESNDSYPPSKPQVHLSPAASNVSPTPTNRALESRYAVCASGLTRSALHPTLHWKCTIDEQSRIGVHTLIDSELFVEQWCGAMTSNGVNPPLTPLDRQGTLHMLAGQNGYVGICRTDGQKFDVAACIDPKAIKERGGIGQVVESILVECGYPKLACITEGRWLATPFLTRSSEVCASNGVFLLGDSLAYIEPFTGEGMAWAMEAAVELASILAIPSHASTDGNDNVSPEACWTQWVKKHTRLRHSTARWVAKRSRQVRYAWPILACGDWVPPLRNLLLRKITQ